MNKKEIEGWIDDMDRERGKELEAIGLKVRNAFVIPFCNRHRLTFSSGMGTWCFWDKKGGQVRSNLYNGDYWVGIRLEELRTVCEILFIDCGDNSIGDYVANYGGVQ